MLTDAAPLLDQPPLRRDARVGEPAQTVASWRLLVNCLHCATRTWPMGRSAAGHRREQCLHCGQNYVVMGTPDDDDDDDD